jgi:methionyl-tRNA formyltransferase
VPIEQNHNLATWVPRRNLTDCIVDLNASIDELTHFFNALVPPYPAPKLEIGGKIFDIESYKLLARNYICTNGRVVNIDSTGVYIKVDNGLLVISTLSFNGVNVPACEVLKLGQRLV